MATSCGTRNVVFLEANSRLQRCWFSCIAAFSGFKLSINAIIFTVKEDNMAKSSLSSSFNTGKFHVRQSTADELVTFRDIVSKLIKDPVQLRDVTVKAGIVTVKGNLKKAYK